jgi:hypothetical protein
VRAVGSSAGAVPEQEADVSSDYDYVSLEDVVYAAALVRTAADAAERRRAILLRDPLIRDCYDGKNVTRRDVADAAVLSVSRINAILRAGPATEEVWMRAV